jgi:transposase
MQNYTVYLGIDTGMGNHEICLEDSCGKQRRWKMAHRHKAFWGLQRRLQEMTGGHLERVVVGIEGHNGHLSPLDRYLVEWGCQVKNVDARKLKAFRDTFGVPCKTDVKDAQLIIHLLKQDKALWNQGKSPYHPVRCAGPARRKLKKWARYQKTLVEEKTRLMNRLTKLIHEISPELLDVADLKGTRMLRVLRKYPSVRGLKRATLNGLEAIKQFGPTTARRFKEKLEALEYDSEMVGVYTPMIEQTVTRILELKQQIQGLETKLETLAEEIEDVQYLMSFKGCGLKISSRIVGEMGRVEWFNSHNELAAYLGVACVDHQSGNQDGARPVYPANAIGKASMMQLAELMIQHDPESRRYYDKKRDEGKKHNDAVRRVARQIVKIMFRMLNEKREYIPYSQHSEKERKAA